MKNKLICIGIVIIKAIYFKGSATKPIKFPINVKGIILNNYDENDFMPKDNKIQVENLTGVKVVATVKQGATTINDLSDLFKEV